jgi:hypothetical protein
MVGAPVNAIAEAVRGLARDRSALVDELVGTSRSWLGYSHFAEQQAAKIEAIDRRVDKLLEMSDGREEYITLSGGPKPETP